ncbi:hypothetical protein ABW286_10360 [Erwinia papayae]|uniref:Uncharacterized protein n=1 Tax=Erwinia papayae TaxID=206499 RepID=A0ABV3N176_9GAMM
MYTAIAIYGTESVLPETAFRIGMDYFQCIELPVTKTSYFNYLANGDHQGDHETLELSVSELKERIYHNDATSFRLYSEKKGHLPWLASFGYSTNEFGGFFHLDGQYPDDCHSDEKIIDFINRLSINSAEVYGIVYSCDKVSNAFYYSAGNNLVNVYPYENSSLFKKETPGRFQGEERYKFSKLRMIYPINILNENHLLINVNGITLQEWILEDKSHGLLEMLNNGLWLWRVENDIINPVNEYLGELGILISWKKILSKRPPKKIP